MSKQSSSLDDGSLNIAFFSVLIVSLSLLFIFSEGEALPKEGEKELSILAPIESELKEDAESEEIALYNENTLLTKSPPVYHKPQVLSVKEEEKEETKKIWVRLTAYAPLDPNATEGMCFSGDPRITASGSNAREGIVAANFLPFGTEIRIPSLYGKKVFVVEDRMGASFVNTVDILVSSRQEAFNFGSQKAFIEIIN